MTKAELIAYINNLDVKEVKIFTIMFIDNDDKKVSTSINA